MSNPKPALVTQRGARRLPRLPLLLLRAVIVGNGAWALLAAGLMVSLVPGAPGLLFLALTRGARA